MTRAGIEVAVETASDVLVLRAGSENRAAARTIATVLPSGPERTSVLTTSAVTGRADLFDLLPETLTEHLGGSPGGVTLVALGVYAAPGTVVDRAQELADWIGQDVVVPVPALGTDGPQPTIWVLCEPGRPARSLPDTPASAAWRTPAGHTLVLPIGFTEDGRPTTTR